MEEALHSDTLENSLHCFGKFKANLCEYLLSFVNYEDYPRLMLISKYFVGNISILIKHQACRDKNLLKFYKRHIFLFNRTCNLLFHRYISPYVHTPEGLITLFDNESILIKIFIYKLEEEVVNEIESLIGELKLKMIESKNAFYLQLRHYVTEFISKLISHYFEKRNVAEISLINITPGKEGCDILSLLVKLCGSLTSINLEGSSLAEEEAKTLLNSIEKREDYFTANFKLVDISLSTLSYIRLITSSDLKKEIYTGHHREVAEHYSKKVQPNRKKKK